MSNAPQIIRKISARHIVGNVKAIAPRENEDGSIPKDIIPLYRVFGQANSVKKGESDNGPWTALVGRFEAINIVPDKETGEINGSTFVATQCFLPEPTNSMLADELLREEDGKRVVESIEFAFEVGVKAAKTSIGYEYTCIPLIERAGADPLAALRERVVALPSPKQHARITDQSKGSAGAEASQKAAAGGKRK